jgi:hypothetical protein
LSPTDIQRTPRSEFLCFKFKGVRRIDQITENATSVGWKCRKYQNWKQVHAESTDKALLKTVGDSLIDTGVFEPTSFGRLSTIFYNVQRWRADREEMQVDPDVMKPWEELDRLLHVINEQPTVLPSLLRKEFTGSDAIPRKHAPAFLFGVLLLKMLRAEKVPFAVSLDLKASLPEPQQDAVIRDVVANLYQSVGLWKPNPKSATSSILGQAYLDLGFPELSFDAETYRWEPTLGPTEPKLTVRYLPLDPSVLMRVDSVETNTVLVLNSKHPFIIATSQDDQTRAAIERLLSACAEAMQQMPSRNEDFALFTSILGMILRRP